MIRSKYGVFRRAPQAHRAVMAGGGECPAIVTQGQPAHRPGMSGEREAFVRARPQQVPYLYRVVPAAGEYGTGLGVEDQREHRAGMPAQHGDALALLAPNPDGLIVAGRDQEVFWKKSQRSDRSPVFFERRPAFL